MDSTGPVRDQGDLAEMVELLLEKGVVVNADVVVSVGDTELLGVELRAAIASFETAAKYGLEFPDGTDRQKVIDAAGVSGEEIEGGSGEAVTGHSSEASDDQARSLRMRPGGPAGSGDGGGDTAEPASAREKGASEVDRKTPAGAGDVTIDPAPYEPTRADRDPDAAEPGVDHPEADPGDSGAEHDGTETTESGAEGAENDEGDGGGTEGEAVDGDDASADGSDGGEDAPDSSDADASTEPEGSGDAPDGGGGDGE